MARPKTQENTERRGGRRMTQMAFFLVNVALVLLTMVPYLNDFFPYFIEQLFGNGAKDMLHGMFLIVWIGINVVGWWAAKMGD